MTRLGRLVFCLAVAAMACTIQNTAHRGDSATAGRVGAGTGAPAAGDSWIDGWSPPSMDSLGDDPGSASIRRGIALMLHTRDSLPAYDPGTLNCSSCHLDAGRHENAIPLFGVHGLYPQYNARADAVIPIEDRINYCFTRSLSGSKVPAESREMRDIVAYLAFLSRGVPGGTEPMPGKLPDMPKLRGDSAHGRLVFEQTCTRCHGADGRGTAIAPALWGSTSFSIGASLARPERAASFIRHNMPFDKPGSLSDQQAIDVATFVTAQPRPDMPGKASDWPRGGAPADLPYATQGHVAVNAPRLLPRLDPKGALVPPPQSVIHRPSP